MRNNPFFRFLEKDVKNIIIIAIILIVVNVGTSAISDIFMGLDPEYTRQINFYSQANYLGMTISFIFGMVITLKHFSGAISIRGNRKDFLRAFASWSVIITLFIALFATAYEVGLKFLMESIIHKEVDLISSLYYVNISGLDMISAQITPFWFIKTILYRFVNNLSILSLSFMLGAIGYRLSKRANIVIFILIPTFIISYLVSAGIKQNKFVEDMMFKILDMIAYLYQHLNVTALIQIVCIGIFSFVGTKFLIKAPTKEYANDLI